MKQARYLRKNATHCERILWRHLRNRHFQSYKFRRQHPIDPYILDFYCPTLKLAIELDGSGHGYPSREAFDEARETFLAEQGITVIRFWNHQLREDFDAVRQRIWETIEEKRKTIPHLNPLPLRKGEAE